MSTDTVSLTDRISSLLADAESEQGRLHEQRQALLDSRDQEISEVREKYRPLVAEIDDQLAIATKLRKVLEGPQPRERTATKSKPKTKDWTPSQRKRDDLIKALVEADRSIAIPELADLAAMSKATASPAMQMLRDAGLARLVSQDGSTKYYSATPQGQAYVEELNNG